MLKKYKLQHSTFCFEKLALLLFVFRCLNRLFDFSMFKIRDNRVIKIGLFAVMIFIAQSLMSQTFSSFFVDFLRYPERQVRNVDFPYQTGNGEVRNSSSYSPVKFISKNNIPIVCLDSLNHITNSQTANVSMVNMAKGTSMLYTFNKRNGVWKLKAQRKGSENGEDSDFIAFLKQYSTDESLQMKRTIFPFPYRIYNGGKNTEPENKLLMPREWEPFDFIATFPSICVFSVESMSTGNNRRLFVFKNGSNNLFFNFIKINKKWYLIEMEEYK